MKMSDLLIAGMRRQNPPPCEKYNWDFPSEQFVAKKETKYDDLVKDKSRSGLIAAIMFVGAAVAVLAAIAFSF